MSTTLFAIFGLWETTLAAAAGAAAIPVIIHLLNRRRFRIVVWAAMKFLLAAQKQNTRRMRLEQLILLAARVLLVLLIVLAMASVMPWAENVWAYFWPEGGGFKRVSSGRTHKIIVLDASLSMNLTAEGGKSCFENARRMAMKLVLDSPTGDGFSVALMKDSPVWIVPEPSRDGRKVAAEIEALRPGHGNAAVPATLNMVAAKLAEGAGRFSSREIYFFTDMQKTTWLGAATSAGKDSAGKDSAGKDSAGKDDPKAKRELSVLDDIQRHARTIFVDVGRDAGNLAIADLRIGADLVTTGALIPVSATIYNFSSEPRRNIRLELLMGKAREGPNDPPLSMRAVDQELIELKPNEVYTHNFKGVQRLGGIKFPEPGVYAVQARLEGDDLDPDDARTVIVTVRDTVPVLLVNGKPATDRYDQATEYLRLALNPFPAAATPKWVPLRPKVVTPAQFADMNELDLGRFDAVYFCDVGQFSTSELRRLETHLRRGGGIVFAAGDKAAENLDTINRLLYKNDHGILPARFVKKVPAPPEHSFGLSAQEEAFLEPPLKAFADDDDRVSLKSARFSQYLQVKPAADAKVRTILSFMPELQPLSKASLDKTLPLNDPAIMEWNPPLPKKADEGGRGPGSGVRGQETGVRSQESGVRSQAATRYRGKVVLVTTTLNMDWHTWPGSPSYGAMMQELCRLAVSGRVRDHAVVVGQLLEEVLPSTGAEIDCRLSFPSELKLPDKKLRTELADEVNVFRWADTDWSGIYRLTPAQDPQEYLFAVNVPATTPDQRGSESDLARLDHEKFQEAFPNWKIDLVNDPRQVPRGGEQPGAMELNERGLLGPAVASYLLLAVLVLMFVEVILAWQFGHYSAAAGLHEPATARGWWPILAGGGAAVLFFVLAFIVGHAYHTGDFLGLAPDGLRATLESWLGVPPPAQGEGTRWQVETIPFFDVWLSVFVALGAMVLLFFVYRAEAPKVNVSYKVLLAGLRIFLILLTLAVLLPQLQFRFDRQGWPDIAIIIDDSRSMGEPDNYQDDQARQTAKDLGGIVEKRLKKILPDRIKALEEDIAKKSAQVKDANDPLHGKIEALRARVKELEHELDKVNSPSFRPTRLQLVQALVSPDKRDWLAHLIHQRRTKVHIFHLDAAGRAVKLTDEKGPAGEIANADEPHLLRRAHAAIGDLDATGKDSRLGTAVRQVLDYYRGSSLSALIMFTDGVTTRDETLGQVAEYAAQKNVPLFFIGVGDHHEIRDLKLHDLKVEDTVFVHDRIIFEAYLTGQGYKDLTVPVVLRVKDKDGPEKEVGRELVTVDPSGKPKRFALRHTPTEPGRKLYIIEVEPPKLDEQNKTASTSNPRLERTIDVLETKLTKVLYIEGTPRYEFRFIKSLMERETPDAKKNKSVDLKVLLLDAHPDFPSQDRTALAEFPATRQELEQYDVVILGDVNPRHKRFAEPQLKMLADFVRGEDAKGQKSGKTGGGLLMIAGPNYAPHAYKDTALADVLPIEPLGKTPPEIAERPDGFRLQLTPVGRQQNMLRFSPDDNENQAIWNKLAPIYWWSEGYRLKPLAEVLAVHPFVKAATPGPGQDARHPLIVQQFVGSGRSMFFGFDESWRWRFREDELRFNQFWVQGIRYLSRSRINKTVLRLDRQTPYRLGEPIKVTVTFPDSNPGTPGVKLGPKSDVQVIVEHRQRPADGKGEAPEIQPMKLAKQEGSRNIYEALLTRTREGKYRFRLMTPDVSHEDPSGKKPEADATVELPPGELDRLRMNQQEMTQAAEQTRGRFYTLANAENLLDELPAGFRISVATPRPPFLVWNWWVIFVLVLFLLTAEWLLRKRKHLL